MPSSPRPPFARRLLGWSIAVLARALHRSLRVDAVEGVSGPPSGPVVYAFFHGEQLPLALHYADRGIYGVASRSRDGALLAGVVGRLGYRTIRGSSSRGGALALRQCIRAVGEDAASVALAVDGPRGPRHQAAPGVAAIACATGRPIWCVRARCARAWTLGTWDRFVIPLPFSRVTVWTVAVEPQGRDVAATLAAVQSALGRLGDAPRPG